METGSCAGTGRDRGETMEEEEEEETPECRRELKGRKTREGGSD